MISRVRPCPFRWVARAGRLSLHPMVAHHGAQRAARRRGSGLLSRSTRPSGAEARDRGLSRNRPRRSLRARAGAGDGGLFGALGLALHVLRRDGGSVWLEDPGFPLTRKAVEFAGLKVEAIPVDEEGIDVAEGVRRAPRASLAIVTPGQQAPLGMTLSLARRQALLEWARRSGAWIIEDDYLGELQLAGRAAPALASLDSAGRVLLAGTFSKPISPALRLGFLVVPPPLVSTFATVAACLARAGACDAEGRGGVFGGRALSASSAPHEADLRSAPGRSRNLPAGDGP